MSKRQKDREEEALRQRTESMIRNAVLGLQEELNLRLLCDFGGGKLLFVESIAVTSVEWPVKRSAFKGLLERLKNLFKSFGKKNSRKKSGGYHIR